MHWKAVGKHPQGGKETVPIGGFKKPSFRGVSPRKRAYGLTHLQGIDYMFTPQEHAAKLSAALLSCEKAEAGLKEARREHADRPNDETDCNLTCQSRHAREERSALYDLQQYYNGGALRKEYADLGVSIGYIGNVHFGIDDRCFKVFTSVKSDSGKATIGFSVGDARDTPSPQYDTPAVRAWLDNLRQLVASGEKSVFPPRNH